MDFEGLGARPRSVTVRGIAQGAIAVDKTVTVRFDGNDVTCRTTRSITLAAGDVVLGIRSNSEIIIIDRLHAVAPAGPAEGAGVPAPEAAVRSGTFVLPPVETRTWRTNGSWITADDTVLQGTYGAAGNQKGCAFYGSAPTSLSGATVTQAWVKLKRLFSPIAGAPTLNKITESTRPVGEPTFTGGTAGPSLGLNEMTTFEIPAAYAQTMVDGTSGGLGFYASSGSPYLKFAGRADWAPAWTLVVAWTRVA